jgi:hypothetical protein
MAELFPAHSLNQIYFHERVFPLVNPNRNRNRQSFIPVAVAVATREKRKKWSISAFVIVELTHPRESVQGWRKER